MLVCKKFRSYRVSCRAEGYYCVWYKRITYNRYVRNIVIKRIISKP